MLIAVLLVLILVSAIGIITRMFYSLKQEAVQAEESLAVPVSNIHVLQEKSKVEVSSPLKTADRGLEDIPWRTPSSAEKSDVVESVVQKSILQQSSAVVVEALTEDQKVSYENQICQLKEEVKLIREKAVGQAKNALDVINKLRESSDRISAENEQLSKQKPSLNNDEESHLKAENAALKSEISRHHEEKTLLLKEKEALKAVIDRGVLQTADDVSSAESDYKKKLAVLSDEISSLHRVNEEMKISIEASLVEKENVGESRARIVLLETDNARLKEKNEFLQYELTKAKAQSAGLQRVCDNFRKKAEDSRFVPV